MGVTGLWRLIEPAGKPVPVETLENKVLAVDISIWLHQIVKGYQDAKGAPLPNAHLIGLFQRLCKLLYFRIKPVFVFDGAFPELKKETIAKRQDNKAKYNSESERLKRELALLFTKKSAISNLLGKDISPKKGNPTSANDDDLFKLPALPENKEEFESESEDESSSSSSIIDLHSVDIESDKFKSLAAKDKYDLLLELKETRKMNSWGKIHELPKKSDSFSDFQMQRLLKRRKVQECLEETEKEMGDGGMSLNELESLLNEEGIDTEIEVLPTKRIASNNTTRYLLINNVKQALADAKKRKELENNPETSKGAEPVKSDKQSAVKDELEEDLERAIKMSLECGNECDISCSTSKTDDSWASILTDSDYSDGIDSEEEDGFEQPDISTAKAYIMQYSDYTNKAIDKIVSKKSNSKNKTETINVDKIIEEINLAKSVIVDNINLSSDEDCQSSPKQSEIVETEGQLIVTDSCIKATQASVIYVENELDNIISLDSSCGEKSSDERFTDIINSNLNKKSPNNMANCSSELSSEISSNYESTKSASVKVESESSDDEFEEVPEIKKESKKTVVELTFNVGQMSDVKDDIFADIFICRNETKTTSDTNKKIKVDSEFCSDIDMLSNNGKFIKNDVKDKTNKDVSNNHKTVVIKDNESYEKPSLNLENPSTSTIKDKVETGDLKETMNKNKIMITEKGKELKSQKSKEVTRTAITSEKLSEMAKNVVSEESELLHEKGRLDRIGRNITEQMTKEAQELLQIFGIPYIVAPMEAEAQCAFLESVKLTDGTITDDSDIWLFGGKTVYKNFFNQKKHVLQFLSERIERSFNLTREQLVLLSLLVGSDYTTGVDGVGPVTAMEILASFPYNKKQLLNETSKQDRYQQIIAGLQEFKKWVRAGKRTDNTSLKKKLKNVSLNEDFPSVRVVQAYMEPNIERSKDKFAWGEIDITILRDYTKAKFGWSQTKLDEIINPVLKRITERKIQRTVQDYFKRKVEYQSIDEHMSKRVKAAVQKMGTEIAVDEQLPMESNEPIPPKKKKTNGKSRRNTAKTRIKSSILPGKFKEDNTVACEINDPNVTLVSSILTSKSDADIIIPKTDRFQEIIPQREKDKQCLLQNKMKAIELFRKTKIDRKKKPSKKKVIQPKDKAELSESSDED